MMVHPASCGVPRAPHYSGKPPRESQTFHLRGYHTLWLVFPDHSVKFDFGNSPRDIGIPPTIPHNTLIATPQRLTPLRFELIPVRSPLLRKSRLISTPPATEMFHFAGLSTYSYVFTARSESFITRWLPHSDILGSKLARS